MSRVVCDEVLGHNSKEGYLSKKNRKGYYNSRYFQSVNEGISYWIDKASFDRHEEPSSTFEIKDIKNIERSAGGRVLSLVFGDKFRIDLKSEIDDCNVWYETLTAKKSFYSVKELLSDLQNENTEFATKTFSALMVIPVKEQNEWITDQLNDIFESAANDAQTSMLRSNPMWVIKASRSVLDEFISTCDECALEMESRNPRLSAHCRGYMHRYAEILKGRLALELSFFMEAGNKQITEMGERALCAAISLMNRMSCLRGYTFLPHEMVNSLTSCLFSVGELMSALLNLSIQRIEAWFCSVIALPPSSRGSRLVEINQVLLNALIMIDFHAHEEYGLYKDLLIKVAMSLQLNFSDQLLLVDLSEYDEMSLLSHIKACHVIVDQLPSHFDIKKAQESDKDGFERMRSNSKCLRNVNDSTISEKPENIPIDVLASSSVSIELSPAAIDSVRCACLSSARTAAVQAVHRVQQGSVTDLLDLFFVEGRTSMWIGGEVCQAYLDRLNGWLDNLLMSLPEQYISLCKKEAARVSSRMFLHSLIKFYHEHKRSKFSENGRLQVLDDMRVMSMWLMELFENVSDVVDEQQLFLVLDGFIRCDQGDILQMYALSLQTFGIKYALELYDLLRLTLKIRNDCTDKTRKGMLALCAEFHSQLQNAIAADINLLGGAQRKRTAFVSVFNELCPKVGSEHCTGKKWSIERMKDPVAVRTLIARFVTETCTAARKRERDRCATEEEEMKREAEEALIRSLASAQTLPTNTICNSIQSPPPSQSRPPLPLPAFKRITSVSRSESMKAPPKPSRYPAPESAAPIIQSSKLFNAKEMLAKKAVSKQISSNPFGDEDDETEGEQGSEIDESSSQFSRNPPEKCRDNDGNDSTQDLCEKIGGTTLESNSTRAEEEGENDYIDEEFEFEEEEVRTALTAT